MKDARYFNRDNVQLSLSNLYSGEECSVVEILDVVEDSKTAEELADGLNKLQLSEKFTVDRKTDQYVRLKSINAFGILHYSKAYYDETE